MKVSKFSLFFNQFVPVYSHNFSNYFKSLFSFKNISDVNLIFKSLTRTLSLKSFSSLFSLCLGQRTWLQTCQMAYYLDLWPLLFQKTKVWIEKKRKVTLWLIGIITAKNKWRRLPVVITSLMVGLMDPTDTLGSFWMPPGSQRAPRNPRVLTTFLHTMQDMYIV